MRMPRRRGARCEQPGREVVRMVAWLLADNSGVRGEICGVLGCAACSVLERAAVGILFRVNTDVYHGRGKWGI